MEPRLLRFWGKKQILPSLTPEMLVARTQLGVDQTRSARNQGGYRYDPKRPGYFERAVKAGVRRLCLERAKHRHANHIRCWEGRKQPELTAMTHPNLLLTEQEVAVLHGV